MAHENVTGHTQQGGGGGYTVLPCAGFGDDTGFAYAFSQKGLAQDVIDLVRAGMVQLFPFKVDIGAADLLCQIFGMVEQGRAADVQSKLF